MLELLSKIKPLRIASGDSFSLCLTEKGMIYSWGIG